MSRMDLAAARIIAKSMRLLHDNVLIFRDEADDTSAGGIALPDQAKEKPARGTVLGVGPGMPNKETGKPVSCPTWAKVGDHVLFTKYGGVEFDHKGCPFIMVSQEHLLAVEDNSDPRLANIC